MLRTLIQHASSTNSFMQALAETHTSTQNQLSDISNSQSELHKSQTIIQARLDRVESLLSYVEHVGTFPSAGIFVFHAAPSQVATAYTTCALVEDKSCSSSSASTLDSRSLLERNPPPPPSGKLLR